MGAAGKVTDPNACRRPDGIGVAPRSLTVRALGMVNTLTHTVSSSSTTQSEVTSARRQLELARHGAPLSVKIFGAGFDPECEPLKPN